jgi:uncharacterized protein YbjT (DUF2867 family)
MPAHSGLEVARMQADPIVVTGATGRHGGAVARELVASGYNVRALVRDPGSDRARELQRAGIVLVRGDLADWQSVARAFLGAGAVYAVTTAFSGGTGEEGRQGANIIRAAEHVALPWLVLASVAAANRAPVPQFRSKARIESWLREANVPWTVIAPSYFYENVFAVSEAIRRGTLPLALPADRPLQQVALADLGALVAAVLRRKDEHLSQRVEVAADAPTPEQMASAIGVKFVHRALGDVRRESPELAAMYQFLTSEGYGIDVPELKARFPEVSWLSFADWARRGAWW